MPLTAEDGTILKPKEGIVLDRDGRPLASSWRDRIGACERQGTGRPEVRVRSFSFSLPAVVGAILFVPLAIAMGFAFFSGIGILIAVFFLISLLSRLTKR